ncbi:MAG: arginase [Gemmatimonadaceae bacterium]|jgi:arginase|nr:arginase [Gemmatimonadaceae bacterium]
MFQLLRLIGVPLDLGASRRGVDMGPSALRIAGITQALRALGYNVHDMGNVGVPQRETMIESPEERDELAAITQVCRALAEQTADTIRTGGIPLALGGDHSLAAGSVAGAATALAERNERLGLLWLDAHGDLNTPETSSTGNVHGMPVAHLLGLGNREFSGLASVRPAVQPEHVAMVGLRDLDPPERDAIRRLGIAAYTMRDIDERGLHAVMTEAIGRVSHGTGGIHVSCDADWIDPSEAPGVGTPVRGGATYREAHLAMEMIADTHRLVSMDFVELNPTLDRHNVTAELGVELIASALGKRTL